MPCETCLQWSRSIDASRDAMERKPISRPADIKSQTLSAILSPILPLIFTPSLSLLSRPHNADQDRPHCRTAHGERSDCHRHRRM
ncbi:hypothetical protein E4U48_004605 [Claviceps purpurea]|nr:hypothetical protein E4U48_004605 [Claviceps purpurea]